MGTRNLKAARWGELAAQTLERWPMGRIAALFDSSFYLEVDDALVCVGDERLGNGPLNVATTSRLPGSWKALGLRMGETVAVVGRSATVWHPPPFPKIENRQPANPTEMLSLVAARAPMEGLSRVILKEEGNCLVRMTRPAVESLSRWLVVDDGQPPPRSALLDLLGLGPGLTPSGDDLLGGLLIALHGRGLHDQVTALSREIATLATGRTTSISRAHLRAAMNGQANETIHEICNGLLAGGTVDWPVLLDRVDTIGHSSGWDMLAGMVIGIAPQSFH